MPSLGPAEILVVLVIALLVFGPNKMPDIARQVGKGMREFKRVQQHLKSELRDVVSEFDAPSNGTPPVDVDPVPMLPPKADQVATPDPVTDTADAPPTIDAAPMVDPPASPPAPATPVSDSSAEPAATEPGTPAEPA
jgi:TatA/E family protein of Tat protein translocase